MLHFSSSYILLRRAVHDDSYTRQPDFVLCPLTVSAQPVEFNKDIRPILSDKCFSCHGPDAATRKTKLRFDIESAAKIELGKGRYAIVAGDPDKSEMVRRITSDNKAVRMPPAYLGRDRLSDHEIDLIRTWIAQGAKWEPFWSFVPPKKPAVPQVKEQNWPRERDRQFHPEPA